ncbi:MAG: DUF2177 family protein [Candidatus Aminicenantes bacterium]|nr:DUF2177 family protein [Candidatus Aminicenantes bacterium]
MPFGKAVLLYALTVPVFFAVDMVWLGLIAKPFYAKHIGHLMAAKVRWTPALIFYFLYIAGIIFFAVLPALERGGLGRAVLSGALLGLIAYATYDLTNLATLRDWPVQVTVIDLVWGMVLTGSVAAAGFGIAGKIL